MFFSFFSALVFMHFRISKSLLLRPRRTLSLIKSWLQSVSNPNQETTQSDSTGTTQIPGESGASPFEPINDGESILGKNESSESNKS
jgi:hypothetical protein